MRRVAILLIGCAATACGGGSTVGAPANDGGATANDAVVRDNAWPSSETGPSREAGPSSEAGPSYEAGQEDSPPSGDAAGCPQPVDCNGDNDPNCHWPFPTLPCSPIDEIHALLYCANGYMILYHVYEGGNVSKRYFRDAKLIAVFYGYRNALCTAGPPDFVEPDCVVTCIVDLCGPDASTAVPGAPAP